MSKSKLPVSKLPTSRTAEVAGPSPYKPSKQELDRERRYKAEDACRTLQDAAKIKGDKQLMNDAKQVAKEKIADLKRIK